MGHVCAERMNLGSHIKSLPLQGQPTCVIGMSVKYIGVESVTARKFNIHEKRSKGMAGFPDPIQGGLYITDERLPKVGLEESVEVIVNK